MSRLSQQQLFDGCRTARRLGLATGERLGTTAAESVWPDLRATLGLPSRLDQDQEDTLFESFAAAHQSSATMRAAASLDVGPTVDNRATQVLSSARVWELPAQWVESDDDDPPETPLRAAAAFVRAVRTWFAPKPPRDDTRARVRTAAAALRLECRRHAAAVDAISRALDERKGRRT